MTKQVSYALRRPFIGTCEHHGEATFTRLIPLPLSNLANSVLICLLCFEEKLRDHENANPPPQETL